MKTTASNFMIGKKCIVRTYSAGVWFGKVELKEGTEVVLSDARRMWKWKTKKGISLSSVAISGIQQSDSRIAEAVPNVWLEAIEMIPTSATAEGSIEGSDKE